jgi:hypothetical protein
MARILPTGLIPKTTQNYKPLWVPNPKIPMEFREKPNPYPWIFSGRVIPMGTRLKFLPLGTMSTRLKFLPSGTRVLMKRTLSNQTLKKL